MKTKEVTKEVTISNVTISNIKFNLSTKPLVSEPETYPDYPSVPVNQITNKIITNLINYLPELINAGNHFISLYINTDDCLIEFSTKQPDSSDNPCEATDGITFTIYFD